MRKLEDETIEAVWTAYSDSQLPPVEVTGEFARDQIRKAFLCGAWTMLSFEDRLRKESLERRTALLDRLRGECEAIFQKMEGEGGGGLQS